MGIQEELKALADPTRREILQLLKQGKMSAGDIAEHFDITNAAISRHLSILKEAGFVRNCREGKYIFYEIDTNILQDICTWLSGFISAAPNTFSSSLSSFSHEV